MPERRRRCILCGKLTYKWQRINGGSWHCYDGCHSTLGIDIRTWDGQPAWLQSRIRGRFGYGPFHKKRMKPQYQYQAR